MKIVAVVDGKRQTFETEHAELRVGRKRFVLSGNAEAVNGFQVRKRAKKQLALMPRNSSTVEIG